MKTFKEFAQTLLESTGKYTVHSYNHMGEHIISSSHSTEDDAYTASEENTPHDGTSHIIHSGKLVHTMHPEEGKSPFHNKTKNDALKRHTAS